MSDRSYGVMVSTRDSESLDPGSTPGRTFPFFFLFRWLGFWLAKNMVCSLRGLNSRPLAHKTSALPTELREHVCWAKMSIFCYLYCWVVFRRGREVPNPSDCQKHYWLRSSRRSIPTGTVIDWWPAAPLLRPPPPKPHARRSWLSVLNRGWKVCLL